MRNFFWLFLLVVLSFSCSKKKTANKPIDDFTIGKPLGELKSKNLEEASGLVESIQNPGYLWTHNDSGNGPEVFLLDTHASIKLTCTLKGVENRDWEDIAIGPGPEPGKNYIYIADIGDNYAVYPLKYIYRFEEPVYTPGIDKMDIAQFDKITFRLSDKQKDTEALLLDPKTKDLYVISKREEPVYVYQLEFPQDTNDTLIAKSLFSLPLTQIVAGNFSVDGRELLLKNYEEIYYWKIADSLSFEQALKQKPKLLAYKQEPQGEAIAWARDGSGFYTLTEKVEKYKCILYFHKRK